LDDLYPTKYWNTWRDITSDLNPVSDVKVDPLRFEVKLDAYQFKPEEIQVRVLDNMMTIEGKHVERDETGGFVNREFRHRYLLPDDVNPLNVNSEVSRDGILTVDAPRTPIEFPRPRTRRIPITSSHYPALEYNPSVAVH
jgi:crystallin alpha B